MGLRPSLGNAAPGRGSRVRGPLLVAAAAAALWLALTTLTRSGPVQRLPELEKGASSTTLARSGEGDVFLFRRERRLYARPVTGGATRVLHEFPAGSSPEFVVDGELVTVWTRGAGVSDAWLLSLVGRPPQPLRLGRAAWSIRAWDGGLAHTEEVERGRLFRCSWRSLAGGEEVELWSGPSSPRLDVSQGRLILTVEERRHRSVLLFTSPREPPALLSGEAPGGGWGAGPVWAGGELGWLEAEGRQARLVRWRPGAASPARTPLPPDSSPRLFSDGEAFWLLLRAESGVAQALHRVEPDGAPGPPSERIRPDPSLAEVQSGYFYYFAPELRENWLSWSGEGLIQERHMVPHRVRLGRVRAAPEGERSPG